MTRTPVTITHEQIGDALVEDPTVFIDTLVHAQHLLLRNRHRRIDLADRIHEGYCNPDALRNFANFILENLPK